MNFQNIIPILCLSLLIQSCGNSVLHYGGVGKPLAELIEFSNSSNYSDQAIEFDRVYAFLVKRNLGSGKEYFDLVQGQKIIGGRNETNILCVTGGAASYVLPSRNIRDIGGLDIDNMPYDEGREVVISGRIVKQKFDMAPNSHIKIFYDGYFDRIQIRSVTHRKCYYK